MKSSLINPFLFLQYLGLWHDIESYPSGFQEGECPNALYTLPYDVVDVLNTQVINQNLDTMRGTAVPESVDDDSGKFLVSFPIAGTNCKYQGLGFNFLLVLVYWHYRFYSG